MTRSGRWLSLLLTIVATVAGLALLTTQPAAAGSRHRTLSYVALGDSYAAGQGAGAYRNACLQSRFGYPALLDRKTKASLRADATCTGATTSDVISDQVLSLDRRVRLVTLTVGGNDLDVAGVAAACAPGPSAPGPSAPGPSAECQGAIDAALALLAPQPGGSVLAGRLATTYATVAAAAPRAQILVTGYPYLFEPPDPNAPNAPTILAINNATTALNTTIRASVGAAAAAGANIVFVDVTAGFDGHGIGSPHPYFVTTGPDAFHPTAKGYRVYATALREALTRS
jgi:lysophospholipase L1-like esterase